MRQDMSERERQPFIVPLKESPTLVELSFFHLIYYIHNRVMM